MHRKGELFQKALIFIGACIFALSSLSAQTEIIAFEKYGVAEGLPEEYVTSMVQDDQGYIWATTQVGLVRYNGYNFKVIRGAENALDSTKLRLRNLVGGMIKGKDGKLWLGAILDKGGIASYDPESEEFRNYTPLQVDSLSIQFRCYLLFEDSRKCIWFINAGRDSTVVSRLNAETGHFSNYPFTGVGIKANDVLLNLKMLEASADSSVWLLDRDFNLRVLNREKDEFELVVSADAEIPGSGISDRILAISKGIDGNFLLVGSRGFHIWDPVKRTCKQSYTNIPNKDNTLPSAPFLGAIQDVEGNYWAQHAYGIFILINPEDNSTIEIKYGEGAFPVKDGLKNQIVLNPIAQNKHGFWSIIQEVSGNEWAYSYYDFSTKSFSYYNNQFNEEENPLPTNQIITNFLQDKTNLLWIYTRPNFYKQAPKKRQVELIRHNPKDENSIHSDSIYEMVEDQKNRLWLGTPSGLSLRLPNDQFRQLYFRNKAGVKSRLGYVSKIYEDRKGQIWVGSNDHGLMRLNESRQEFEQFNFKKGINRVNNIQEDHTGNLWVSCFNHGVYILDGNTAKLLQEFEEGGKDEHGLLSNRITDMYQDLRNNMWLGDARQNRLGLFKFIQNENRFKHYERDDTDSLSLYSYEIRFITEDDLGRVWVGTDEGINLYDHEKDVFYKNTDRYNLPSLSSNYSIAQNGKLWITSYGGGGLALVGPGINDVEMYGEEKGMLHNDAYHIIMDDLGNLWLPTDRGFSVFDTLTKTFTNYAERDGFEVGNRFAPMLKTQNGNIWAGGENGLIRIEPIKLFEKDTFPPDVLITSMGIMDSLYESPDGDIFTKAVSYTDNIDLKYWQKDLSFDFVALHYHRSEDNLYSWKLENYDDTWSTPSRERRTAYTNLSPGKYTFRVKGSNADGVWNEEGASMEIYIAPPWWRTWWAYSLYSFLLLFLGYRAHLYQKAQTIEKERKKTQEKELQHAKEIQKAYTDLQNTQKQLIHSEKMASLGELTAGIAHEIQNPLNFVNNFSEVSHEMIEEVKEELKDGDPEEADAILSDLSTNLEKIAHHGKRASGIVRSMLDHSRASGGEKVETDLNALCDEYLRLAYHGMRAKDRNFNAKLETSFDESLPKVKIIPQDIGRVLLNLINNAFQAVSETGDLTGLAGTKDKTTQEEPNSHNQSLTSNLAGLGPKIKVTTKKIDDKIQITVSDNGPGIPDDIKDKIFQPFFTTKPTGEGTGLGLSLSYDIIKAHGGELKVRSKVGEGTIFKIILPNSIKRNKS
ncbi:MAG: hypothetical protein HKN68_21360 [Saprospiraceae bacterium]|nr:hypothetical protein [Saprospiraceae bacterium]